MNKSVYMTGGGAFTKIIGIYFVKHLVSPHDGPLLFPTCHIYKRQTLPETEDKRI
jgi:hypothetical protein